jgi:hypothetical protein
MMKSKLWIPALLAAVTFSASAFAHGGDRYDSRDDYRHEQHYSHRHAYAPPPPPPEYRRDEYRNNRDYRYESARYEQPAARVYLPLPPSPFEVHRAIHDALFGR